MFPTLGRLCALGVPGSAVRGGAALVTKPFVVLVSSGSYFQRNSCWAGMSQLTADVRSAGLAPEQHQPPSPFLLGRPPSCLIVHSPPRPRGNLDLLSRGAHKSFKIGSIFPSLNTNNRRCEVGIHSHCEPL